MKEALTKEALTKRPEYHRAFVEISPERLLDLLKVPPEGIRIGDEIVRAVKGAIPEDAKALRGGVTNFGNIILIFESASLESVPEGMQLVRFEPQYEATDIRGDSLL